MRQHYSKTILILAFGFMLLIIAGLSVIWAMNVMENNRNIEGIFAEQTQSRLVREMRDAARQRAILLHRMSLMKDEFEIDTAHMMFKEQAGRFIGAREQLLALGSKAGVESEIWKRAVPKIRNGEKMQQKTLDYILNGRTEKANQLLLEKVIPIQNNVNQTLSEMFTYQKQAAFNEFQSAIDRNNHLYNYVLVLGGSAVVLTFITALVVIRRTTQIENRLDEARVSALTATELKSQFLANMSHEIRTPLTAVLGFAENMLDEGQTVDERQMGAHCILRNGNHLMQVINDILDISKIEAKQLAIEIVESSPVQLIADIDALMGVKVRDKGLFFNISYDFPLPEYINSDPTRLKQILLNLCSNATKFTEYGGIDLHVSYEQETDDIIFVVRDTGIGMKKENLDRLFKPFSQADDSTTRKYGGTGLGLYISKQLAQMLGGDLTCVSAFGKGSDFTLRIRANKNANTQFINRLAQKARKDMLFPKVPVPILQGEILLAEDSPDNQVLISMHIKKTGANITTVNNGKLAIEYALEKQYDLILMDMQMPVMGGAEAVEWLRQTGNQTPIIMLTANAMKTERDKCLSLGANDFLTKPIDRGLFYRTVSTYLKVHDDTNISAGEKNDINDSEFENMRHNFIVSLPEKIIKLKQYQQADDWDEINAELHRLKGVAGGLGYPEITDKCREIERYIIGANQDKATALLMLFYEHCDSIFQHKIPNTKAG